MPEQEALQRLIETHTRACYPRRWQVNAWLRRDIPTLRFECKEHRFFRGYAEGLFRREQSETRSLHPEERRAPLMATFDLAGREFYELLPDSGQESRCDWCRGTGRCPFCDGRGANPHRYSKTVVTEPCLSCAQTGRCEHCKGNKTHSYQRGLRIKFFARKLGPHSTAPALLRDKIQWQPAQTLPDNPYRETGEPNIQGSLERFVNELKREEGLLQTRTFLEEGSASHVRYQWHGQRELWLCGAPHRENALFITPPCPKLF